MPTLIKGIKMVKRYILKGIKSEKSSLSSEKSLGIDGAPFQGIKPFDNHLTHLEYKKNIDILLEVATEMLKSMKKK